MKDYYIYRHLKINGEVFYIGMGKNNRATSKFSRNPYWYNIVKKYGYEVQILKTGLTKEGAFELEKLLINWYGRKDLSLGNLVNMSDGGEGNIGHVSSRDVRLRHSVRMTGKNNPNFGITMTVKQKEKISNSRKLKNVSKGGNNPRAKLVLHLHTGIFYECAKDAAEAYSVNYATLKSRLRRGNRSFIVYC